MTNYSKKIFVEIEVTVPRELRGNQEAVEVLMNKLANRASEILASNRGILTDTEYDGDYEEWETPPTWRVYDNNDFLILESAE